MSANRAAKAFGAIGLALTVPAAGLISPRMTPLPTTIANIAGLRRRRIPAARMRARA